MKTKLFKWVIGGLAALVFAHPGWGYTFLTNNGTPVTWSAGTIAMQIKADNTTVLTDGTTRAGSIQAAMQAWNAQIVNVQFSSQIQPAASGTDNNQVNEVFFSSTAYDQAWDQNTLAVTTDWLIVSTSRRIEADIIFNAAYKWDSYPGNLIGLNGNYTYDIRRVALHELGHALGLNHPDLATPPQYVSAIMNSATSNIYTLQPDDIAGAQFLYGAPNVAPSIYIQPSTQTVYAGQIALFTFLAKGNPPPTYQWQCLPSGGSSWANLSDDTTYSGTASNTLSIGVSTPALNGDQFRCVATNIAGSITSSATTLTVNPVFIPVIIGLPATLTLNYGDYLNLSASIPGNSPTTCQWSKDGVNIPGAVYSNFSKINVTTSDSGSYVLTATNYAGTTSSSAVVITVNSPVAPAMAGLPTTLSVAYGNSLYLFASTTGTYPITYQWQKGGVNIPNATAQSYYVNSATSADSGIYILTATNVVGTATSQAVAVNVAAIIPPLITQQPLSIRVSKSLFASFSVNATGSPTLLYQWFKNGQIIPSAVNSFFNIQTVTSADSGAYSVQVTNGAGSVTSSIASLTVLPATLPTITFWSGAVSISPLSNYFSLNPNISGSAPFTYQWFKDGVAIAGANLSSYYHYAATAADAGTYTLQVSNEAGLVISPDAVVTWTNNAASSPWLDAVQLGDVVYFLASAPGRIMRYNLVQESWLPITYLPEASVPTAFLPTAEGVFIAYNDDLVRRSLDLQTEVAVVSSSAPIQELFSAGKLIYYQEGGTTRSWDRSTLTAGPDSPTGTYVSFARGARPVYSASLDVFYGRQTFSPNNIEKYSVGPDGVITDAGGSPYNGSFRVGSREYLSPDESLLLDNSGVIHDAVTLNYTASVGLPFDDLAFFADGTSVALRGKILTAYSASGFIETGHYSLGASAYSIFGEHSALFAFGAPPSNSSNPVVTKVASFALVAGPIDTRGSPIGKLFSVDDAFIDGNLVIHLLSRTERGIVRWDTKTGAFLPTTALRGNPAFSSYAPALDRFVLAYGDGTMSDIFPTVDSTEQIFGYFPVQNRPFSLVAMDDLTFLNINQSDVSANLRLVIGSLGELKDLSTWSYWGAAQAW
ncbi:MAG: immunoglobulin domain-containing protein [Lacunisphaera sp.]